MSISSVIITKNEEKNIETCIQSILSFSDEIVIVDDFSTDRTREIALRFPKVQVFERSFDGYIHQKNYANSLTHSQYIFSIDADEYCSEELIQFMLSGDYTAYDVISFLRINKIGTKEVRHGLWKRDIKERLWKNGHAEWAGKTPHEHLEYPPFSQITTLYHILFHNAYSSVEKLKEKSIHYASMAAVQYAMRSYSSLIFGLIFNPIYKFVKGYVFKQGFRDGKIGWMIAQNAGIETYLKYWYAIKIKWKKS